MTNYELQLKSELESAQMGRIQFEQMIADAVSKQREGSTVYGLKLMTNVYESVKPLIVHYIDTQFKTRRKSPLFLAYILPAMETKDKEEVVNIIAFMFCQIVVNKFSKQQYLTNICCKLRDNLSRSLNIYPDKDDDKKIVGSILPFVRHLVDHIEWLEIKAEPRYKEAGKTVGGNNYVEATDEKQKEMAAIINRIADTFCVHKPMIVQPKPHKNLVSPYGGFLHHRSPLLKTPVRLDGKVHQSILDFTSESNPEFFKWLNHHQEVGYQINKNVLNAIPLLVEAGVQVDMLNYSEDIVLEEALKEAKQEITDTNNERIDTFGDDAYLLTEKQCERLYKQAEVKAKQTVKLYEKTLEAAYEYADVEEFFFPIFLDERGRIYYYSKTIQPQGSELHKSLLQFSQSALMTDETVIDSLIALGNCLGYDKYTLEYRIEKAKEFLPTVLKGDVVEIVKGLDEETALTGLAIALDIKGFYDAKEKGESYYTHQPLHMDSCNSGSQINGLLLRDERNCRLSNILNVSGDKLADTYLEVANLLKSTMEEDTSGVFSKFLDNPEIFNRKVFKKSSMTRSNYNAGYLTCSDDIKAQLKANHREFWDTLTNAERKLFISESVKAVDDSLPASNNYKKFAKKLIREAVKRDGVLAFNNPRSGFPVVLRENKKTVEQVKYRELFTGASKSFNFIHYTKDLDVNKTVSSAIPGITHSFDAGIIVDVKKRCGDIPMTTIHDSIAVLAGDVSNKLLPSIRDSYYDMAINDDLRVIRDQLGLNDIDIPYTNNLNIELVKQSKHLYS